MQIVGSKWKKLSEKDHKKWQGEARKIGKADPKLLSDGDKVKAINKEKKKIMKQVSTQACYLAACKISRLRHV